jgi:acyl-CoA reductase-like NAD-dependent aldehyde dehydrogenase
MMEARMKVELLVNGQDTAAEAGRTYERHDPVTGDVASTAAAASVADALAAVDAAQAAFPAWAAVGPSERRALLNRAADIMDQRAGDFIDAMVTETGATKMWAGFNVKTAAGMLREAAAMTTQVGGEIIPANKPDTLAMGINHPRGVCLGIAPWNAPVILGTRAVAMPLACGNTTVLKASELCPRTHALIAECLNEAGLPAGVINLITNAPKDAPEVVKALIEAPAVRHVNFTGSTEVGRIIGRLAGENLKPALLELGGKAPLIVLEDADIDGAVNAAIFGAFMNQGQICMSTERVIVVDAVADEFVQKFSARAAGLVHGNPRDEVVLGSLVSPDAAAKMDALIADATAKGAKLVAGGERDGAIHAASLLDGVTSDMRIYSEESFGPVKSIIRVKDTEDALRTANDTEYGLSSAVFSQDIKRALDFANRLQSGICHINGPTVADEPQMPFGGVKDSGYGRFGGKAAIAEFTDLRWVTIEDPGQHYPF